MSKRTAPEPASRRTAGVPAVAGVILLLALVLRWLGARNDLWLDEILALNMARQVTSLPAVFTGLHSEINHHLYTIYLFLTHASNSLAVRLPSLLAGTGTVALAGLIGRRRSPRAALLAMALTGFSYVLTLYSSEARGYALAVFFAFLCTYALESYMERRRMRHALLFSFGSILGMVSQLVFVSFSLAALAWSAYHLWRARGEKRSAWRALLSLHALPALFLAVFYLIDIRTVTGVAGATSPSLIHSYGTALAWGMGAPSADIGQFLACALALMVLLTGTGRLRREGKDSAIFYLGVIVVFPVLLIAARGQRVIYPRYFILAMAFNLLLLSFVLDALLERGRKERFFCLLALLAYLASNGVHTADLLMHGRGRIREALRYMEANSAVTPTTLGSEQDYRNGTMARFYIPEVGPGRIEYRLQGAWPPGGPEWVIYEKESFDSPAPDWMESNDLSGNTYDYKKVFPTAPLSGLHWLLYHNRRM